MKQKTKTFLEMEKESISYIHKNESYWIEKAVLAAVVNDLEKNEHSLENAFIDQDSSDPGGQDGGYAQCRTRERRLCHALRAPHA